MSDLAQSYFDRFLPRKSMFRPQEVAELLGVGISTVGKLVEVGRLPAHQFNAGRGERITHRIPREGVMLFLLQSKTYEVEDYLTGVGNLLARLSVAELDRVNARMPALLARAKVRAAAPPSSR